MRLASLDDASRDGSLIVVNDQGDRFLSASAIAPHLQAALDNWRKLRPELQILAQCLKLPLAGQQLELDQLRAPLPRAYEWIDGSAYLHHIRLSRKSRGAELPPSLSSVPLAYQGGSGVLLGARAPILLPNPAWDLDLEGEICVIVGDVAQGISSAQAERKVLLVMLANDLTYRALVAGELAQGFGFLQSKPATAFSPWAVTPDELAPHWRHGRLHLTVRCSVNGKPIGQAKAGAEMHFSFGDLIAHAAKTRSLTAGTIIGSGTVSTASRASGASCLVELRAQQIIDHGTATTPYLRPGDTLRIEALTETGISPFGAIEQSVIANSLSRLGPTASTSPSNTNLETSHD